MLDIVEIIGREESGTTNPYVCRVEGGDIYYVKGHHAGRRSQICELVCGELAKLFEIPIAPFEVLNCPGSLLDFPSNSVFSSLGVGPAFGSLSQDFVQPLRSSTAKNVEPQLAQDIFMFDFWVKNQDRLLTEFGGNSNLLWLANTASLVVIDHNLAFDQEFEEDAVKQYHTFADVSVPNVFNDVKRQAYEKKIELCLKSWDEIVTKIPGEWFFADTDMTVETGIDVKAFHDTLRGYQSDDFWK